MVQHTLFLLLIATEVAPAAADPGVVVRFETSKGNIDARLALSEAPVTVCNFLRYALGAHYDGGRFFRTVRSNENASNPVPIDVIQLEARDGEEHDAFGPIALERTSVTGLTHRTGALSMARWGPDTATSSFSIVVKPSPAMDFGGTRNGDGQGFAVFGYVIRGMDVVRAIHRSPADAEKLREPVAIRRTVVSNAPKIRESIRKTCGSVVSAN